MCMAKHRDNPHKVHHQHHRKPMRDRLKDVSHQSGHRGHSPEQKSLFLRLYFLLAMLYGLLGFLHSLLIRNDPQLMDYAVFTEAVGVLSFVFVLFSVSALVFFWQYRYNSLVFVLPWYYVIFQSLLIVVNYIPLLRMVVGLTFQTGIAHTTFTVIGVTTSLFEFFFAFYVIERLRLFG